MNNDRSIFDLNKSSRVLIIHHWDCDGICSAALLIKYLHCTKREIKVFTETGEIGKYYLNKDKLDSFKKVNPSLLIVCDYAIPREDILKLKCISDNIGIFDHHKQEEINDVVYVNPCSKKDIDGMQYPSTGWVINEYFNKPQEILAVLGSIGDQGDILRQDKNINEVLKNNFLDFKQAQEIVINIDSSYIVGDEKQIRWMVGLLSEKELIIRNLLSNKKQLANRRKIEYAISEVVEGKHKKDESRQIIYVRYKSDLHIISRVTRELSKKFPGHLIIVINDSIKRESNIYFRNKKGLDMIPVIKLAHKYGFNAGGKTEVAGVILPSEKVSSFLSASISILETYLSK